MDLPGRKSSDTARQDQIDASDRWTSLSHVELLPLCLNDAPGAWEEFLRRFSDLIYSTLRKYSLTEDDRREAYQATIVAIHERLVQLRSPESLIPWIIGIAMRQAALRIRLYARESIGQIDDIHHAHSRQMSAPGLLPPDQMALLESAQQLREGLDSLSRRCRRLLTVLFLTEPPLDYREIAESEGLSMGSIGPLRGRCLERLREYFAQRGWLE